MALEQKILNLYKRVGETPLECLNRYKIANPKSINTKMSYLGRLDPMAEGVLLVSISNLNLEREKILNLDKVYEFECLWGIETDTQDALGKITNINGKKIKHEEIQSIINIFIGKIKQVYPVYSSKTIFGKPLFTWAREGRIDEVILPKRNVEIFSIEILSHKPVSGDLLLENICEQISKVKGDFRQEEILNLWKKTLNGKRGSSFFITKMRAHVSSGTYIRTLVHEIGKALGTHAIALNINRTRVGNFSIDDSILK